MKIFTSYQGKALNKRAKSWRRDKKRESECDCCSSQLRFMNLLSVVVEKDEILPNKRWNQLGNEEFNLNGLAASFVFWTLCPRFNFLQAPQDTSKWDHCRWTWKYRNETRQKKKHFVKIKTKKHCLYDLFSCYYDILEDERKEWNYETFNHRRNEVLTKLLLQKSKIVWQRQQKKSREPNVLCGHRGNGFMPYYDCAFISLPSALIEEILTPLTAIFSTFKLN